MERFRTIAIGIFALLMVFILPQATIAIVVGGIDYDDPMYSPASFPTINFGGLAAMDINYTKPDGTTTWTHATGALLNTPSSPGLYVLTAAHPLTDDSGNWNINQVKMKFYGGGVTEYNGTQFFKPVQWNGDWFHGGDIAVIKLGSAVPGIAGYNILTNDSWIFPNYAPGAWKPGDPWGTVATFAGYGYGGLGTTGFNPADPFGTLRVGQNKIDVGWFTYPGSPYAYDFDDGNPAHDAFGNAFPEPQFDDTGLSALEIMTAGGDSGGPAFVTDPDGNILLAGVTSFGNRFEIPGDGYFDWVDGINSSFGEFALDTRTAAFNDWINGIVTSGGGGEVPEPATMILLGSGLLGLWGLRRKFKK